MNESTELKRSLAIGKAIELTVAEVMRSEPSVVITRLDNCLSELLKSAETDWERKEISRRVAEAKLSILWESTDRDLFLISWREMERLGYSNPEREASMLFYFLEFNARNGASESSCKDELDRLENLVKSLPPTTSAHFQGVYDTARVRLAGNAA